MNTLCTYCDSLATTRDHVPPKAIFVRPLPSNLITVPACDECNQGFKSDDELLSLFTCLSAGMEGELQSRLQEKVRRAVARHPSFKKILSNTTGKLPIFGATGEIEDELVLLPWDFDHLRRACEKIVIGLFRHHYSVRIIESGYPQVIIPTKERPKDVVIDEILNDCVLSSIGHRSEFSYRHGQANDAPGASFWEVSLYRSFVFYGFTVPLLD